MNKFVIITDATCDLPQRFVEEFSLDYIPMEVNFGEEVIKQYLDGSGLKLDEFYARLDKGELAKTTLINMTTFVDKFTPHLEKGLDVFYLGISSALSATWMQANMARDELLEEFPERKIVLVDTKSASIAEGLLVLEALKKQKTGSTIEEVRDHVEAMVQNVIALLAPINLETLRRGGRLSAVKAIIGDTLGVKPILTLDKEGKLVQLSKARGFKNAIKTMVDMADERLEKPYTGPLYIVHANNEDAANSLASMFKERYGHGEVMIAPLGPVISAHTGTGAVCVVFLGSPR